MIVVDRKGYIGCQVTSSTHERKSCTNLIVKGKKYYLKHNSFTDDMPVVVVFNFLVSALQSRKQNLWWLSASILPVLDSPLLT